MTFASCRRLPQAWMAAVALIAAPGCASSPAPAPQATPAVHDVPFRLDNARTGYDGSTSPRNLRRAWTWSKAPYRMLASPMVRGGRVYVAGGFPDINGTFGVIVCIDAKTGQAIWEVTALGGRDLKGIFSSPVLSADGTRLVIGEGLEHDDDCCVYCLDAATGKLLWKRPVGPHHVWSTPAVAGATVVVGAGAVERNDHKPVKASGYVLGLSLGDGRELWRYDVKDPEGAIAIGDDRVAYVPNAISPELVDAAGYAKALAQGDDYRPSGHSLCALLIEDEAALKLRNAPRQVWRSPTPYPAGGAVALTDKLAIVGCGEGYFGFFWDDAGGAVAAFDRASGKPRWCAELGQAVWGPVAVRNGRVLCPTRGGELVALDVGDGHVLWRARLASGEPLDDTAAIMDMLHAAYAGPAATDKYAYAVSSEGWLFVLDVTNGRVLERHYLNDPGSGDELAGWCVSSPVIVGGRLYVGSETGGLHCYVGSSP